MQNAVKLKPRWIATVLREAERLDRPMPWQRKRKTLSIGKTGADASRRTDLARA